VKKFNKGIAKIVTSWIDVKISSSFAIPSYVIIIEFYRAIEKKSSSITKPLVGSLQHCFPQS
jgi:hypothetical protein